MSDFLPLAQSLSVALKALQMYTASHPRSAESLAATLAMLQLRLSEQDRLQVVVTGGKLFVDSQLQDGRSPHITTLVKLVSERGIGGFVVERGVTDPELLAFLQGLGTKPTRLEELGGFPGFLENQGVRHIRVSQTRYQEVTEGTDIPTEPQAPAFNPAPAPSPSPENLVNFIRDALLKAIAPSLPAADLGPRDPGEPGFLKPFGPADLSGLSPLGRDLGLGEGMPTPGQLGTLRQVLMSLTPEVQLGLLAGLRSLPEHPAGLGLGVKALSGEILAVATSTLLNQGATWNQLRGPLQDILRPLSEREFLVHTLTARLRMAGQDATQAELILRHLEWESLSLEAKLLKVLEEGHLFELSLEQRLALLRDLLDLRRFDAFLRIQDVLLEALRSDRSDLRMKAIQTLGGMARWALEPGLPPGGEGALADALRAHFAWEPEPLIHRWTSEALEALLAASVRRGELERTVADLQELEGLCVFLEEQHPWRNEALAQVRASLAHPELMDAAIRVAFLVERERLHLEVQPFLEAVGTPMARHLVARLGEEGDRTRRGRLVESLRGMGASALPALLEGLGSPAWFLVRNVLTLLSDIGDAGCVPSILPLLRHPEARVRRTAVRALWKLGGPVAEPHLLERMKDTDAETMQEILFALGQLRSEAALGPVAELAQDKRVLEKLRIQALDTLGLIASPKALPVLLECMRRKGFFGGGEPSPIRLAAARAVAALGTSEALAALKRATDTEPAGDDREALLRLLNRPDTP